MTLWQYYVDHYEPCRLCCAARSTRESYRSIVLRASTFHAKPLAEITLPDACSFLAHVGAELAAATVNKYRRSLLAVAGYAAKQGFLDGSWIDDVPKWTEPKRLPEAWTTTEIEAMVAVARSLPANVNGCLARHFWPALILTLWNTGLRITPTMSIASRNVSLAERSLIARAETQKHKADQWFPLQDSTVAALTAIYRPDTERLFNWPHDRNVRQWPTLTQHFRRIIDAAGLRQPEKPFHKFRASCASYTDALGGDAQQQLGHSSRAVTARYLDPRITRTRRDVLPRLDI